MPGNALIRAFSRALVFAWNFSPDCVKPVDERQRFSPHEHIYVGISYHEASRFSLDAHVLLVPFSLGNLFLANVRMQVREIR